MPRYCWCTWFFARDRQQSLKNFSTNCIFVRILQYAVEVLWKTQCWLPSSYINTERLFCLPLNVYIVDPIKLHTGIFIRTTVNHWIIPQPSLILTGWLVNIGQGSRGWYLVVRLVGSEVPFIIVELNVLSYDSSNRPTYRLLQLWTGLSAAIKWFAISAFHNWETVNCPAFQFDFYRRVSVPFAARDFWREVD